MVIDIQQEGGETKSASGQTDRNLPLFPPSHSCPPCDEHST